MGGVEHHSSIVLLPLPAKLYGREDRLKKYSIELFSELIRINNFTTTCASKRLVSLAISA